MQGLWQHTINVVRKSLTKTKPALLSGVLLMLCVMPTSVHSQSNIHPRNMATTYIDAYANFVTASTFEILEMFFSLRNFPSGDIGIGTNKVITSLENNKVLGSSTGSSVAIRGVAGETVQITCTNSGALSNGAEKMPISNVEVVAGLSKVGLYGTGTPCTGDEGTTIEHTLTSELEENTLFIGAKVKIDREIASNRFSTALPEGQPVVFDINYI